jgi:Predicted membrane protein (DUF2079)
VIVTASGIVEVAAITSDARAVPPTRAHELNRVWRISQVALLLQLAGIIAFSTVEYGRFNLTNDFADYSQAWAAIAHGHLDPYSSVIGLQFWRNDLELLLWPLALFYWLYPHGVLLLWLQDFAVVGAELVVIAWAKDAMTKRSQSELRAAFLLALVTLLVLITPWSWFTAAYDFHLEPFATLFALLAARDLWNRRHGRLVLWVPLTLISCAAAGSLYVVAIGLAALATTRGPRAIPAIVVAAGCVWLLFASAIGGMELGGNHALAASYGYLAGGTGGHASYSSILAGLVVHPVRALDVLRSHASYVAGYVASGGIIGLASRWGVVPAAVVLLPSALNATSLFINFDAAFQSWAAVLFLIAGSAVALQAMIERHSMSPMIAAVAALTLAVAIAVSIPKLGQIAFFADRVAPAAVTKLAALNNEVPKGADVVVSQGVIGRFAAGRVAYYYFPLGTPERYVVSRNPIWFLIGPVGGPGEGAPNEMMQAITYLQRNLHATLVTKGAGIWAFRWSPPGTVTSVVLP